jgi:hypothetical protein
MDMMDASVVRTFAKALLGRRAKRPSLPLAAMEFWLCSSNWKSETPVKLPAMPMLPRLLRSRLAEETGVKLKALAGVGATAAKARTDAIVPDIVERREGDEEVRWHLELLPVTAPERRLDDIRILSVVCVCRGAVLSSSTIRCLGV